MTSERKAELRELLLIDEYTVEDVGELFDALDTAERRVEYLKAELHDKHLRNNEPGRLIVEW